MLTLPDRVTVVEVGARDGLQSLGRWIDTEIKIAMIDRLSDAGFPVIETTSFASPSYVPMLTDAEEVVARIKRRPGTVYRALVPNKRGALRPVETEAAAAVAPEAGFPGAARLGTERPQVLRGVRIAERFE